eukprot:TRINITY_DN22614_c0_g1_i1.p1 TRINITY_DN22614_c0_g1~~TRINITY_DN22614_c0_g1_i1.p1  ORF type:complete len:1252 (-),score=234.02 TRINITY_DN22614_c0_g1_i1:33-3788(-)
MASTQASIGSCVLFSLPESNIFWECGTVIHVAGDVLSIRREETVHFVSAENVHRIASAAQLNEEYDDFADISDIHESTFLWALRVRTAAGHAVTPMGRNVLFIVPQKLSDSQSSLSRCLLAKLQQMYSEMRTTPPRNQCIVLRGPGGSGKTSTLERMIELLPKLQADTPPISFATARRIALSLTVLQAFGNASTISSRNSTRFASLLQAQFSSAGQLVGAFWRAYLLERTRLSSSQRRGGAFHAFYQLVLGTPSESLHLKETRQSFLIAPLDETRASELAEGFQRTDSALHDIGFSSEEKHGVWRTLAGILHLSCVAFQQVGDACLVSENSRCHLVWAAEFWRVSAEELEQCVTTTTLHAPQPITKPLAAAAALQYCEQLCQAIYRQLFDLLVQRINVLTNSPQVSSWLGIMDTPGPDFDDAACANASFGQLVSNIASEWLHARIAEDFLQPVVAEVVQEGLPGPKISPSAHSSSVVHLAFGAYPRVGPSLRVGLLPLLDDECAKGEAGTPASFIARLASVHPDHAQLQIPSENTEEFSVVHSLRAVRYSCSGWIAPLHDPLSAELRRLFVSSSSELSRSLVHAATGGSLPPSLAHQPVAAGAFQQLQALSSFLLPQFSATHFAFCVQTTNPGTSEFTWCPQRVLAQLRALDCCALLTFAQHTTLHSFTHSSFHSKFRTICPQQPASESHLIEHVRQRYGRFRFHVGHNKIFLSALLYKELDGARQEALARAATCIQRFVRAAAAEQYLQHFMLNLELYGQLHVQVSDDEAFDRQVLEMQQEKERSRLMNAFAVVLAEVADDESLQFLLRAQGLQERQVGGLLEDDESPRQVGWVGPAPSSSASDEDDMEQLRRLCREELHRSLTSDSGQMSREIAVQEELWETIATESSKRRQEQETHVEQMQLQHLLQQHSRLQKEEDAHIRLAHVHVRKEKERLELRRQLYQEERMRQALREKREEERRANLREQALNHELKIAMAKERRLQQEHVQLEQRTLREWESDELQHSAELKKLWANCKFQEAERARLLEQERRLTEEERANRKAAKQALEQWREKERRKELAEANARREKERQEREALVALAQLRQETELREKEERRLKAKQWEREQKLRVEREKERERLKQRFNTFTQHSLAPSHEGSPSASRRSKSASPGVAPGEFDESHDQTDSHSGSPSPIMPPPRTPSPTGSALSRCSQKPRIPEGLYSRLMGPTHMVQRQAGSPTVAGTRSKSAISSLPEAAALYKTKAGTLRWK